MEEYTNKILNKEKELCKEIQRLNIELDDMQHDYEKLIISNRELKYENTQIINELNDLKNKNEDRENKFKEISKSEIWKQMNEYKTKNEELENKLKYYTNNIKSPKKSSSNNIKVEDNDNETTDFYPSILMDSNDDNKDINTNTLNSDDIQLEENKTNNIKNNNILNSDDIKLEENKTNNIKDKKKKEKKG
jgi:hypothetical protein